MISSHADLQMQHSLSYVLLCLKAARCALNLSCSRNVTKSMSSSISSNSSDCPKIGAATCACESKKLHDQKTRRAASFNEGSGVPLYPA